MNKNSYLFFFETPFLFTLLVLTFDGIFLTHAVLNSNENFLEQLQRYKMKEFLCAKWQRQRGGKRQR